MLEVHPPHEPVHGWRDFFIHLATIFLASDVKGLDREYKKFLAAHPK